jgi:hypothetical protein
MNVHILNKLYAWQICNEKKVVDWMKKEVEAKWDQFQIEMQHFGKVWWPLFVRFTFNKLLHIIGIPMWGVG